MGKRSKHSPRADEQERLYFDKALESPSKYDKRTEDQKHKFLQRWASPKNTAPYNLGNDESWIGSVVSAATQKENPCSAFMGFWKNPGNSVARQLYKGYNFVDFYHCYEDVPSATTASVTASLEESNWRYWLLLCLMGAVTAVICFTLDIYNEAIALLLREQLIEDEYFFLTIIFSLVCAVVAVVCCHKWAPQAVGSGIPQMKVILNGGSIRDFLSMRTLLAKSLGLAAAITAGLHVGKEGPYVHIAAIVAALFLRLKMFRSLITSPSCRTAILAAAVGAGVTASFGSPIGGLLLSIEVTATFFMGHSLLRSYLCCGVCYLTFKFLRLDGEYIDLFSMKTDTTWEMSSEVIVFVIIGICGGLLGGLFLLCVEAVNRYTESHTTLRDKLTYICTLATVCTIVSYFLPFTTNDDHLHLEMLLQDKTLDVSNWKVGGNVFVALFAYVLWKLFATALSVNSAIPCGVFTPTFVAGAAAGRFIGELLVQSTLFKALIVTDDYPAVFAMAGAAALSAGVTRTVSVIAIVCELTGDISLGGPVLIAVLCAYFTSRMISVGFYDLMLHLRQLPCVAGVLPTEVYRKSAADVMTTDDNLVVSAEGSSLLEFFGAFVASNGHPIPLVKSKQDRTIFATISYQNAQKHLRSYRRGVSFGLQNDDEDNAYLDQGIHGDLSFQNSHREPNRAPVQDTDKLSGRHLPLDVHGPESRGVDLDNLSSAHGSSSRRRDRSGEEADRRHRGGARQSQQQKYDNSEQQQPSPFSNVVDLLSDSGGKEGRASWNALEEDDRGAAEDDRRSAGKHKRRGDRLQGAEAYYDDNSDHDGGDYRRTGKHNKPLKNEYSDNDDALTDLLKRNYPHQCSLYELQLLRVTKFTPQLAYCDCSPLRVLPSTSTSRLHFMLTMLSLSQILICDETSLLLGVVRCSSLIEAGRRFERLPFRSLNTPGRHSPPAHQAAIANFAFGHGSNRHSNGEFDDGHVV